MSTIPARIRAKLGRIVRRLRAALPEPSPWAAGASPRVLFGSGTQGAPLRYRVLHQAEQLALAGLAYAHYSDSDERLTRAAHVCDLLYLYRVGDSGPVRAAMTAARARSVPIIYDTDDLIWEQRLVEYCALESNYQPDEVASFRALFRSTEALMREADAFVASTPYLAAELSAHFAKPVYVNANAVSQHALALCEPLYRQRLARPEHAQVTIAYFSGWPKAHEEDLAVALPAVLDVLRARPACKLRIVGHFDLERLPAALRPQVEKGAFVAWERLPAEIAAVDVNLAPIVNNPHRRGKSAVKFLEAALVGTPTVASDLEPYREIVPGTSGFLASDAAGWRSALLALVDDAALRRQVGAAARSQVLARDTTAARAPAFAQLVRRLAGS